MNPSSPEGPASTPESIAAAFVEARLACRSLPGFPGTPPVDLATGYACQDAAIARWPDLIAGWKVGYISPDRRDSSGEDRLVGPIFARAIWPLAVDACLDVPVFVGGFAAVEAEYVFRLGADAPPGKALWTAEETLGLVAALHVGIEIAGSPLATINVLGPSVVVSDFGNNAGLLLGPEVQAWRSRPESDLACTTTIDDALVGRGGAASLPGGLLSALAFALGRCARRGFPLKAGALVTTGAATGIHDILPGQRARISFGSCGELRCRAVPATPLPLTTPEQAP